MSNTSQSYQSFHNFWQKPDEGNEPEDYVEEKLLPRSKLLYDLTNSHLDYNASILEIGCNAGRNLNYFFEKGYLSLNAIEIRQEAINCLNKTFPQLSKILKVKVAPVEDIIKDYKTESFDLVFTMAVLAHIHPDSDWVFNEITRITKDILITIEDESQVSWKHVPRNYQTIFENLGFKQINYIQCDSKKHKLNSNFLARVFKKNHLSNLIENH